MSVTLTSGSTVVTLPTPDYPEDPGDALRQTVMRAMGGRIVSVTQSNGVIRDPVLHFTDLSETDYNNLASFINNTVVGATTSFTYTDWDSTSYTVRYVSGIPGQQVDLDQWVVDLALAVVPVA